MKLPEQSSPASNLGKALESMPAAVGIYDARGRFLYTNRKASIFLADGAGRMPESVLEAFDFLPHKRAPRGGGSAETYLSRAGLPSLHIGYRVERFDSPEDGAPLVLVLFQDISESSENRRENDRFLRITSVSKILPSIAHEILNPLAGIQSLIEIVLEEIKDPQHQEDLGTALEELFRVRFLLRALDLADRDLRDAKDEVDLSKIVSDLIEHFQGRASQRGVRLVQEEVDGPVWATSDAEGTRFVLGHLLNNSLEASRRGDEIVVAVAIEGPGWRMEVRDSGEGMSADVLARAADPFFSTKKGSSGIGLTLAKDLVERCGGQLRISSTLGVGTVVVVALASVEIEEGKEVEARKEEL